MMKVDIGIIGAMSEEVEGLIAKLSDSSSLEVGMIKF